MDGIDKAIVEILQQDARTSHARIGERVGLAASSVTERIKRLVQSGVIRRWTLDIDHEAVGLHVLAFIYVFVSRKTKAVSFIDQVSAFSEVQQCHHITGDWSYLLMVRATSISALESFMLERLQAIVGVERTHTQIALSSADLNRK